MYHSGHRPSLERQFAFYVHRDYVTYCSQIFDIKNLVVRDESDSWKKNYEMKNTYVYYMYKKKIEIKIESHLLPVCNSAGEVLQLKKRNNTRLGFFLMENACDGPQ